jgi:uracil-DNA glycosylase family 4
VSFQDKIRNPNCELCPLHEGAEHVCLMGSGTKKAKLMVVGEAPGEREDESHKAFVGPAGKLLDELLQGAGFKREACYITNVVKCRPPGNATPSRGQAKTCSSVYLAEEIRKVDPTWILLLGNTALQAFGRSGITKQRGNHWVHGGATVFATYHPAYALRSPKHLPALQADFRRLRRLIIGESSPAGKTTVKSIRTKSELRWLRAHLAGAKEICFDVENGPVVNKEYLSPWEPGFFLVSCSFSTEEGTSYVLPLTHAASPWKDSRAALRFLKPVLEDPTKSYIAHNGKTDILKLAYYAGIFIPQTFDTMLAAHILDENRLKGLKPLSEIELGSDGYELDKDKKADLFNQPWGQVAVYNGKDTDYALRLKHLFHKQLKEPENARTARLFMKLMMPASNMLAQVEQHGVWMDPERLDVRYQAVLRKLAQSRRFLVERAGAPEGINLNSPQQVAHWLFGEEGLGLSPVFINKKSGSPSTNEATILRLARENKSVRALLLYRQWAKYENTYLRRWLHERDSSSRFHPQFKPFGTVTGRLSGDFQQVPRNPLIRSIVGAPPGWVIVKADYSQVELRIAAMLADERSMLQVFARGGDIHLATAVAITGKRPEDITKEERKKAKAVNFGYLYGMGWQKFIAYAFENYGVVVNDAEAQKSRRDYFRMWPALLPWHDRQKRSVHRHGLVVSPLGRTRHLPDVRSRDRGVSAEAVRQAINSPVQSCASDLMLDAMVELHGRLPRRKAFITATIHDEILFQVREDFVDQSCHMIRDTMQDMTRVRRRYGADISVPIVAELETGQHWADPNEMTEWTFSE